MNTDDALLTNGLWNVCDDADDDDPVPSYFTCDCGHAWRDDDGDISDGCPACGDPRVHRMSRRDSKFVRLLVSGAV